MPGYFSKNQKRITTIIALIFALALGLRLYRINTHDLWYDELITNLYSYQIIEHVADSQKEPIKKSSIILNQIISDTHAPVYYLTVYFYSMWFGNEKSLRMVSAFFSMLLLMILYQLSCALFNRRTALYAILITALSPLHIWYAQEARGYAMASCLAVIMIYCLARIIKNPRPSNIDWAIFGLTSILGLYTSYYIIFIFCATAVIFFWRQHYCFLKKWLTTAVITGLALIPSSLLILKQTNHIKNLPWLNAPNFNEILQTLHAFNLGYSSIQPVYIATLITYLFLFANSFRNHTKSEQQSIVFLAAILLSSFILIILASFLAVPIYATRQLLFLSPFYYLIIAKGFDNIRPRLGRSILSCLITVLLLLSLINNYGWISSPKVANLKIQFTNIFPKKNQNDILTIIQNDFQEEDLILTADIYSQLMLLTEMIKNDTTQRRRSKSIRFLLSSERVSKRIPWINRHQFLEQQLHSQLKNEPESLLAITTSYHASEVFSASALFKDLEPKRFWVLFTVWYPLDHPCIEIPIDLSSLTKNYTNNLLIEKDGICLKRYDK